MSPHSKKCGPDFIEIGMIRRGNQNINGYRGSEIGQWQECLAQDQKILSSSPSHAERPLWDWPPRIISSSHRPNKPHA